MHTTERTRRAPLRSLMPYEATVAAALIAVTLAARAEEPEAAPADERERDAVHDAALGSFPASDAPSWTPLRVGLPASDRHEPAAR
jgi:hypothetical protein